MITIWLVVWTPLKNISQLDDYSQYMGNKKVPNHQPDCKLTILGLLKCNMVLSLRLLRLLGDMWGGWCDTTISLQYLGSPGLIEMWQSTRYNIRLWLCGLPHLKRIIQLDQFNIPIYVAMFRNILVEITSISEIHAPWGMSVMCSNGMLRLWSASTNEQMVSMAANAMTKIKDWLSDSPTYWLHACIIEWYWMILNECMKEGMNQPPNQPMNESTDEWMNERANAREWVSEWVNEWMNERMNEWITERMNEAMNQQISSFKSAPIPSV